ncbi:restriction endonuclease [Brachyspira sp. SAP_772]|uniref:restriction endonuclease n=1 Tax=Brachyspira sp. SAP_772 TaxID=2608385 RepID=UPI0012F4DBBA|nr:restriction endonuclease [Brachyspira sp. SAP_772]
MENIYIYVFIFLLLLLFIIALYLFISNNIYKRNSASDRNIIAELNKKLLKNPNDYNTIYKLALIKDENGDILDALKKYEFLISVNYFNDNEKIKIYKRIESICTELDYKDEAFKYSVIITNLEPTNIHYLVKVAYTLFNEKKYQLACNYFNKAIMSRKEFNIDELKAAIYSYYDIKNYDKAIAFLEDLDKRIKKDSVNFQNELIEIRKTLISIYLFTDKLQYAIEYIEGLLNESNNVDRNLLIYYNRMYLFVLHKFGDKKKFKDVYKKIKTTLKTDELESTNEELIFDYGFYSYFLGYIEDAIKYFETINKFSSNILKTYKISEVLIYLYQVYRANLQVNRGNRKLDNIYEHQYYEDYVQKENLNEWEDTVEIWENSFTNFEYINTLAPTNNENSIDVDNILLNLKVTHNIKFDNKTRTTSSNSNNNIVDKIYNLSFNDFKKLCRNIITNKLSYTIVQEFIDNPDDNIDEIDYLAYDNETGKYNLTFISIKRWQNTNIGELILRDFIVKVKDSGAKRGVLIVPVELTKSAKSYAVHSEIVTIYSRSQLNNLLKGTVF